MNKKLYSIIFVLIISVSILLFIGLKEGFQNITEFEKYSYKIIPYPKNAIIDPTNANSPEYSHTVNLPINDPVSCKNFCGPKAQCVLTREQCTSDVDCSGCNPGATDGKQGCNPSATPYDPETLYINYGVVNASAAIKKPYEGTNSWTTAFNKGLELFNRKQEANTVKTLDFGTSKRTYYEAQYPMSISATGLFYETTPPPANAAI